MANVSTYGNIQQFAAPRNVRQIQVGDASQYPLQKRRYETDAAATFFLGVGFNLETKSGS